VTLCISPVAAARWTGGNDRIAGHHSSLLTKGSIRKESPCIRISQKADVENWPQ